MCLLSVSRKLDAVSIYIGHDGERGIVNISSIERRESTLSLKVFFEAGHEHIINSMTFVNFILRKNGLCRFLIVCVLTKMNTAALTSNSFIYCCCCFILELSLIGFGFRMIAKTLQRRCRCYILILKAEVSNNNVALTIC